MADKSLLVAVRGDTPRFRMLETLREYGVERLLDRGIAEEVRDSHLEYFVGLVERLAVQLRGAGQVEATRELTPRQATSWRLCASPWTGQPGPRRPAGRVVCLVLVDPQPAPRGVHLGPDGAGAAGRGRCCQRDMPGGVGRHRHPGTVVACVGGR
ncbi:hypothetical protein [Aeromicrobium sp. UC242_57]|uniref:hypothetical protein n=1 Tax=Aeromicrobium sp. UC242_57 TaxID=3374624 RepID=UPI0037BE240F